MIQMSTIRLFGCSLISGLACLVSLSNSQAAEVAPAPKEVITEITPPSEIFTAPESSGIHCDDLSCGDSCGLSGDSCGLGCGGGCGGTCDGGCGFTSLMGGLFVSSDQCFNDFISPMTNPTFFEDPRTLSEVRPIFIHHKVPKKLGGGRINLIAMHIRLALTDRLSLIASKDGYMMATTPLLDDGWADVSLGLKYNFLRDVPNQTLASVGFVVETPTGSTRSLQGNGDGLAHIFLSAGTLFGGDYHYVTGAGLRLPFDRSEESTAFYWSHHVDKKLADNWYVFGEANWHHFMRSGKNGIPGIEGTDLFNLGSTGVAGNDIVTAALGFKYKPSDNTELGIAYEIPATQRRDLLDNRLTIDYIYRF